MTTRAPLPAFEIPELGPSLGRLVAPPAQPPGAVITSYSIHYTKLYEAAGTDPSTVLAVHPTQLYETILMLGAFMVLWMRLCWVSSQSRYSSSSSRISSSSSRLI